MAGLKSYFKVFMEQYDLFRILFGYPPVDMDFLKDKYDSYWQKRSGDKVKYHFSMNMNGGEALLQRYQKTRITADIIQPGSSVLDIGCGDGLVLQMLNSMKTVDAYGVDISPLAVKALKKRGFKGAVADISQKKVIDKLPKCDYILLLDIIEHLQFPEKLMINLKDKFRKGIIVNIPNTACYISRLRLLFGKTPAQWLYFPGEHIRFWSITDFKWWCKLLGYRVVRHKSVFGTFILKDIFPNLFSSSQIFLIEKGTK